MLVSSTLSTVSSVSRTASSQLLLRGTRDGDLAATLSSSLSTHREPLFTWADLQTIVSTGNLQNLSRHPDDLRAYFAWMDRIKTTYGSVPAFLLAERLTVSKLTKPSPSPGSSGSEGGCFRAGFRPGVECQILVNDWPYSVPDGVVHHVVWSHLPILHSDLVKAEGKVRDVAWSIIARRGLCGTISPVDGVKVPTLAHHALHLPDLLPSSTPSTAPATTTATTREGTEGKIEVEEKWRMEVEAVLKSACDELVTFIKTHWDMTRCEAAFFANPPSLQSVPALAHFHVLVKQL